MSYKYINYTNAISPHGVFDIAQAKTKVKLFIHLRLGVKNVISAQVIKSDLDCKSGNFHFVGK